MISSDSLRHWRMEPEANSNFFRVAPWPWHQKAPGKPWEDLILWLFLDSLKICLKYRLFDNVWYILLFTGVFFTRNLWQCAASHYCTSHMVLRLLPESIAEFIILDTDFPDSSFQKKDVTDVISTCLRHSMTYGSCMIINDQNCRSFTRSPCRFI